MVTRYIARSSYTCIPRTPLIEYRPVKRQSHTKTCVYMSDSESINKFGSKFGQSHDLAIGPIASPDSTLVSAGIRTTYDDFHEDRKQ